MEQFWTPVEGNVTAPQGFRAAATAAGLKPSGGLDLALILSEVDAIAAGAFTTNQVQAACVTYDRAIVESGTPVRAILCNAGQANACTGREGEQDNQAVAALVAQACAIPAGQVLTASTGVIGRRFDLSKFQQAIPMLASQARSDDGKGAAAALAARAILTTDLVEKAIALEADFDGKPVRVGGIAKGSGMIHPNLATMLAFMTCDAAVEPDLWRAMVRRAADVSFNQVTVDGDTSTNDMLLALANGRSHIEPIDANSPHVARLQAMLDEVCIVLAKAIARDGEGATKLLEVQVRGVANAAAARQIARTIVGSPLVKSAAFGNDPNWGRIAAAAGRSGVTFDAGQMDIWLGKFHLMQGGMPLPFDRAAASSYLKGDPVVVTVDLHQGEASGMAWGCDLSYDYVRINAEYTT
jgi:glutamate N-acetyltransferase/amino-acid N-acetyltransferase